MRAVQLTATTGPDALALVDAPEPAPGPHAALVDVHAAGVSFPELLQTKGQYQQSFELPFVPGSEIAGVVRSAPATSGFAPGDRVVGLCSAGGYAEVAAVDVASLFPLPEPVSFEAGAGLAMNYLTALYGLRHRGRLASGEWVLVHGAGGGVGTASVQIARAMGASVIAATSTEDKALRARQAGATHTVAVDGFLEAVRTLTEGRGVDVVVDPVGGDRFTDSLRSLAPGGRLLVIGFTAGEIPVVKVNRLLLRDLDVVGVGLGASATPTYQDLWAELLPLIVSGRASPVVTSVLPLERVAEALHLLEERAVAGKVVLRVR